MRSFVRRNSPAGVLLLALLAPSLVLAQGLGTIVGTVTDPSGSVVPNAKVTIVNEGTAASVIPYRMRKAIMFSPRSGPPRTC